MAAMSKLSTTEAARVAAATDVHVLGREHALEAALSVLREIDARYTQDRTGLEDSAVTGQTRTRLLQELDLHHRGERAPYVLAVADLHEKMMRATPVRIVH
jgi:hypothetical protein